MKSTLLVQPEIQLGQMIEEMLECGAPYTKIQIVSAFASLRTILRLRERLLCSRDAGCVLEITLGVDLNGTSREVLEEVSSWECEAHVFHNAAPRSIFHPKLYLFQSPNSATIIVGSNNLTDGGLYTNHELANRLDFDLPDDQKSYLSHQASISTLLRDRGILMLPLTPSLIQTLSTRGQIPTEAEARRARHKGRISEQNTQEIPENPFDARPPRLPPLVRSGVRDSDAQAAPKVSKEAPESKPTIYEKALVWKKKLPASDALQVSEGTNVVGGVRLTQAKFESPVGSRIDQTTYFRNLFSDFLWEREGRHRDQERAFVPMRVAILGRDYGIRNFEISHKPSGEAGQANYTTILKWGRSFSPTIKRLSLTGRTLSFYETTESNAPFLLEIT